MTKRKPNQMAQMNLRLREDLRKRIAAAAKKQGRSLNGELVRRLERSLDHDAIELMAEQQARLFKLLERMPFGDD